MLRRLTVLSLLLTLFSSSLAAQDDTGLLSREPETPEEFFDAAVTMLRLSRPELARQYLDRLLESNPDDPTLLAIREKHGTPMFVRMSRMEALQPTSTQLLDRLNAAAASQLADPAFQDSLIRQLTGDARERHAASSILRALGTDAVPLIIARIAQGVDDEAATHLTMALVDFGPPAVPALHAALNSQRLPLQLVAVDVLGRLKSQGSVLRLKALAADPASNPGLKRAALRAIARIELDDPDQANLVSTFRTGDYLLAQAREALAASDVPGPGDAEPVSLWTWDESAGTVVEHAVSPLSARLHRAEGFARLALRTSPESEEAQSTLLAVLMWRDVIAAGWDQPIPEGPGTAHDVALESGAALVERTLWLALDSQNAAASLVALRALSQTGSRSRLLTEGSPLLAALDAADPRVQFMAATTVMELDPRASFPGQSQIVRIFARALQSGDTPRTVVVDPNLTRGSEFAAMLANLGYRPHLAQTGREGFEAAASRGDVQLAALHLTTNRWDLGQTVANLRADPRTASIPIAVYGPPNQRMQALRQLDGAGDVTYVPEIGDESDLTGSISVLLGQLSSPPLTEDQLLAQRMVAAYWLRNIGEYRFELFELSPVEDVLSEAVNDERVARDALIALGSIGKASVQERLAAVALSSPYPAATRETALVQLAFHVQRFGRLLKRETIARVLSAWQDETDAGLRTSWAAVVGTLEPRTEAITERLLQTAPLPVPLP